MSNSTIFKNVLEEKNLTMEQGENEGGVFFRTQMTLKAGGNIVVLVFFNKEETIVDLNIFNVAKIEKSLKKEELHQMLNELNNELRFAKVIENDGEVIFGYSHLIGNHFDAELILHLVTSLIQTVEDVYPRLIKLQWT